MFFQNACKLIKFCKHLNKMNTNAIIVSFVISVLFVAYMYFQQSEENKKDTKQMTVVFVLSLIIIYMITNLIMDCNDDKQVMSNIKMGEPPF